jgi:large-conductance mechanosensitive channel
MNDNMKKDFQEFIFSNNLVVAGAGWVFGLATKEFIQGIVEQVLSPLFMFVSNMFMLSHFKRYIARNNRIFTFFGNITWIFLIWISTLGLAYFILEIIFNRFIVGLKSTVKESDKVSFAKSKLSVENKEFREKTEQQNTIIEEELIMTTL